MKHWNEYLSESSAAIDTQTMSEELVPCPFCGGDTTISKMIQKIYCDKCGAIIEFRYRDRGTIAAQYNQRVEPIGKSNELPGWFLDRIEKYYKSHIDDTRAATKN